MLDLQPYPDFDAAARAVLHLLHQRLGFDLWMVTRTEGNDWVLLQVEDHGYGVKDGTVLRWADSFCSQMVLGRGPRVAPRSAEVPAYASAAVGRQVAIGAYVGVPLTRKDGSLFGTLCGIHPTPQEPALTAELPLVETFARLLGTLLESEERGAEQARRAERATAEALTDALTGVYNRRGWDQLLAAEECRCRRLGNPASVLSIDLDGLKRLNDAEGHAKGDELIRQAGRAIRGAVRGHDVVARLGGDEFAVLGIECDAAAAVVLRDRVCGHLSAAQVEASVGVATRDPGQGLVEAVCRADEAMYAEKRGRRGFRCA
jgi:diguanylate cyclase (GGDEF)-like protein